MPYSEKQRRAAGIALAAKRGEMDPKKRGKASRKMYDSMTEEQLADFASKPIHEKKRR